MADNTGTLIAATIKTASDADQFPTAIAEDIKGGFHSKASLTARNLIPAERRTEGMLCYVVQTNKTYQLTGGIENVNWGDYATGSTGGGGGGEVTSSTFDAIAISTTENPVYGEWGQSIAPLSSGQTVFIKSSIKATNSDGSIIAVWTMQSVLQYGVSTALDIQVIEIIDGFGIEGPEIDLNSNVPRLIFKGKASTTITWTSKSDIYRL